MKKVQTLFESDTTFVERGIAKIKNVRKNPCDFFK
jgi:hypothetical protein